MSYTVFLFMFAAIATMQISALPVWEDNEGNSFLLVPIEQQLRQKRACGNKPETGPRRETTYDIGNNHAGLGQKFTVVDNDRHRFSTDVYASRDYKPKGPLTTGNGAEYLHKPSNSNFQVRTENTRGSGTDLSASGTYNFFQTQDKKGRVGVGGEYERHYGGRGGTTDPKYNVFVKGTYDLP